jgi:uncharacterized protein YdeI (YjbR/CyaY-like superfamily)
MNPKVDEYMENVGKWQNELEFLRSILLDCGLSEELKWKHPCYTYKKSNIGIIHEFKEYCAISFFKGVLLNDSENILIQPTRNIQAGRQIRFTSTKEIEKLESIIKSYVFEAIEIEKAGLQVKMKETSEFQIPEELAKKFIENSEFKNAFGNLTPGRQRGYLLHFSQPKQSKTRESRIIKNIDRILKGKGLNDCICGLSKRFPNCDGSHKQLKN